MLLLPGFWLSNALGFFEVQLLSKYVPSFLCFTRFNLNLGPSGRRQNECGTRSGKTSAEPFTHFADISGVSRIAERLVRTNIDVPRLA